MVLTKNRQGKKPITVWLLIGPHGFLGFGAVYGGGAFVIDPSGQLLRIPTEMMQVPLFPDYLIPGLLLLVLLGLCPLGVMVSLLLRKPWTMGERLNIFRAAHWSWSFSLYIGFALLVWIMVQLYILKATYAIHIVYMTLGLAIQAVTLLPSVRGFYERPEGEGKGITMY
ncbi:hypothetical protein [Paenibacillus sp. DYY-L-2]|uniref:hypothetical protein n=1 Tax=Paenibacillus sp. DYY-L-2 TaxID=3447013 RepID=UPI003F4FB7FF